MDRVLASEARDVSSTLARDATLSVAIVTLSVTPPSFAKASGG